MAAVSRGASLADYRLCLGRDDARGYNGEEPKDSDRHVVVMRSGSEHLGRWLTERRNVAEDYEKIFGEIPDDPKAVTISIDSNDTHSMAESFMGPIVFRSR